MLAVTVLLVVALAVEKLVLPRIQQKPWYLAFETTGWALIATGMFLFARPTRSDFICFLF